MSRPDETARALVAQGATLIDVRSPGEFGRGHLAGAINVPVDGLPAAARDIPNARPVVVYCASGARSARAASLLRGAGFAQVHDMGAMSRWDGGIDMQRYMLLGLICLTLGLAPFSPEPHIVGKLRWVAGGAVGMAPIDWGDLLMHGAPWLLLAIQAIRDAVDAIRR